MIERFIAVLQRAEERERTGMEVSVVEVADALWLARHLPAGGVTEPQEALPDAVPAPPPKPPPPAVPSPGPSEKLPPVEAKADVVMPETRAPVGAASQGVSIRVPGVRALPNAAALARALRPLQKRVSSTRSLILDEAATVDHIASVGLGSPWSPVLRPARERWLELALVVDGAESMSLWGPMVAELYALLAGYGAFRDVRAWRLLAEGDGTALRLVQGSASGASKSARSPNELVDSSGRRLIVIVSDCVSAIWRSGAAQAQLVAWGRRSPVALLQALPEKLWSRTALKRAPATRLAGARAAAPNGELHVDATWRDEDHAPIPVLTLEPEHLRAWSSMVAGKARAWSPGVLLPVGEVSPERAAARSTRELSGAERVDRFLAMTSSATTRDLAALLALVPLQHPVMRLVWQTILPGATQGDMAEVFLGGLLRRVTPAGADVDVDAVEYEFFPGVREALRDRVATSDGIEVLTRVSEFISDRSGQALDFRAMLADPSAATSQLEGGARSFARLAAPFIRRLGGEYATLADRLELGVIAPSPRLSEEIQPPGEKTSRGKTVMVAGNDTAEVRAGVLEMCRELGKRLLAEGYELVTEGRPLVEAAVAEGYAPDVPAGPVGKVRLHRPRVRWRQVPAGTILDHADAVILVGGGSRILVTATRAGEQGRVVLPLAWTGGAAAIVYRRESTGARVGREDGDALSKSLADVSPDVAASRVVEILGRMLEAPRSRTDVAPFADGMESSPIDASILVEEVDSPQNETVDVAGAAENVDRSIRASRPERVLWVDDRPENNDELRANMEESGIAFTLARSTAEALELLGAESFDLVISDMEREEGPLEGVVLLDAMRERGMRSPFVIFSKMAEREARQALLDRGGQGYTNSWTELMALVVSLTRGRDLRGTLGPLTWKLWPNGTTLRVRFLDGSRQARDHVMAAAAEWSSVANLRFVESDEKYSELRVSFGSAGNWSYAGTDCLQASADDANINLGSVSEASFADARPICLQTLGHTIGLIYEHQSPNSDVRWNAPVVREKMAERPSPWSDQQIDANILATWAPPTGELPYREFDPDSIMCTAFERSLMADGREVKQGLELSASDRAIVARLYPSAVDIVLVTDEQILRLRECHALPLVVGRWGNYLVAVHCLGYICVDVVETPSMRVVDSWKVSSECVRTVSLRPGRYSLLVRAAGPVDTPTYRLSTTEPDSSARHGAALGHPSPAPSSRDDVFPTSAPAGKSSSRGLIAAIQRFAARYFPSSTKTLPDDDPMLRPPLGEGSRSQPLTAEPGTPPESRVDELVRWLPSMMRRVCSIEVGGEASGTGFLLTPTVVLTSYHVVHRAIGDRGFAAVACRFDDFRDEDRGGSTLVPLSASATFPLAWSRNQARWGTLELPPTGYELDYALIVLARALTERSGHIELKHVPNPEQQPSLFASGQAVVLLQHPQGEPLRLSAGVLLGVDVTATRVRYSASTLPGASGAPCFTTDGNLIAIHHSTAKERCDGVPLHAIQTHIRTNFPEADALLGWQA